MIGAPSWALIDAFEVRWLADVFPPTCDRAKPECLGHLAAMEIDCTTVPERPLRYLTLCLSGVHVRRVRRRRGEVLAAQVDG